MLELKPDRYLPILIGMKTGCRRSELLLLKVENVDFVNKTIFIQATKNSNDREIPLSDEVLSLLEEYIQRAHLESGEQLFPISIAKVFRIWNEVRPVKKKFHALRHTFAVNLYVRTKDVKLTQMALGHRNIQNTEVYLDFLYSRDEMRKGILGAA